MNNKKKLFVLLPAAILALTGCNDTTNPTTTDTNPTITDPVKLSVSIEANEHGSVTADKTEATVGEMVTLTVSVDEGYHFVDLKVNGSSVVVENNVAKVAMVDGGLQVKLEVAQDQHNVVIAKSENGSVTADKTKAVVGEKVTLTVTANEEYELDSLKVNGLDVAVSDGKAVVDMVKGGLSVTASFKKIIYAVKVNKTEHGNVTVDKVVASKGDTVTITATADADYKVSEIKVNGEVISGTSFVMGKGEAAIDVTFVAIGYKVVVNTSEHGSVTANKTEAAVGEDVVLIVAADDDYEFDKLVVNGAEVAVVDGSATVQMVSGGLTVSGSFKQVKHTVTINAMENGSVVADKTEAVVGEDVVLIVTANEGYNLDELKVNNEVKEVVDNRVTVKMVKEGLTVSATFTDEQKKSEITAADAEEITAADDYKIRLTADVAISDAFPLAKNSTLVNLNGHTLTVNGEQFVNGLKGQTITFTNGKVVYSAVQSKDANLFNVADVTKFVLDGVTLSVENQLHGLSDVIHCSNTSNVEILNSTINAKAVYAIGMNNTEGANATIKIVDSSITTTTEEKDNTAFLGNVEGMNVEITNSTFKADRQAVIARCGTWVIKNSTFETTEEFLNVEKNVTTNNGYLADSNWRFGNEVPVGAVVIGDKNTSAYKEKVTVTVDSVKTTGDIVIHSDDNVATVNVDALTYVNTYGKVNTDSTSNIVLDEHIKFVTPAEIASMTAADNKNLYVVTGNVSYFNSSKPTWSQIKVADSEGNEFISHYTKAMGAGTFKVSNGTYSFSGERKGVDATIVGQQVTLIGCVVMYNGKPQLQDALIVNVVKQEASVSLSVNNSEMGSATLSKTAGVYAGDEITVTATPNEGYKLAKVTVNVDGTNTDITSSMTFVAGKVNNVIVEFADASAAIAKTFNVTFNSTNNKSPVNDYSNSWENISDGMTFTIKNCNNFNNGWEYIRAGSKKDVSIASIQNEAAFTNAIGKTSITIGSRYGNVTSFKLIVASDAEFTNVIEEHDLSTKAGQGKTIETEITTPTKGAFYKYEISISKSSNGCVEISSLSFEEVL